MKYSIDCLYLGEKAENNLFETLKYFFLNVNIRGENQGKTVAQKDLRRHRTITLPSFLDSIQAWLNIGVLCLEMT